MIKGLSHIVLVSSDVPAISAFFSDLFSIKPHFSNKEFTEFVLPNRARVAFFRAVGASAKLFKSETSRGSQGIGITVDNIDEIHERALKAKCTLSGPPKEHPWGEKSFLLIDPDGNHWEITESPSADGFLVNRSEH